MPSPQKQVYTQTFTEGMDTTTAKELMSSSKYVYMLNCNVLSTASGNVGVVTNIKGNRLISTPLPEGINRTIGYANDEERNNFYFAVWNSLGYHTWYRYNSVDRNVIVIYQDLTDTNGVQTFNWEEGELILHSDVVRGELLYWTIKGDEARKFDIAKALDKSDTGYGTVILEEYSRAYKRTSVFAPTATYFSDTTKAFNRVYGYQFRFAQRFYYDNGEISNWSDFSNIPLPDNESITGINSIPENNNGIQATVNSGSAIVNKVEIGMLQTNPEGGTFRWVSIALLDKQRLGISDNSSYIYNFYNDGSYPVIDEEKIIRPYSYLPKQPLCQAFTKNAMVYANFKEGFDPVDIDITANVTYGPLRIDSGTINELNDPSIRNTYFEYAYQYDGNRRNALNEITIGNDVKKGNKFELFGKNGASDNLYFPYTATILDNAITVANELKRQLVATGRIATDVPGLPSTNIYDNTIDGSGNVSFRFIIRGERRDAPPTKFDGTVNPVSFNSLKDTGESINNIKLGSVTKYGIIYEDEDGRKSLTYTDDILITKIDPINEFEGFVYSKVTLTINHTPPIWASYYQIVRSRDLIYGNYIQILIQKVNEITATNNENDVYLDLVVGSLFTYQKIHENTTLTYEFKKGDRIRLIKSIDTETNEETYYDFYETEIISYKDTVTQVKDENITINGTSTVTVQTSSAENIGNILRVNGVEREIIAAPTGTTYTLSGNIVGAGADGTDNLNLSSYEIINRNGVIRIKKPTSPEILDFSVIEVFSPSVTGDALGDKQFFEFGYKFGINNAGEESRTHLANSQNQTVLLPAIVVIDNGTAYVRNREMPTNNITPNTQVLITSVEDPSFSDFYISNLNDNGRDNAEDTGTGEVNFGSRFRFSNNFIEDTRINGLNDFDNTDREDYNDKYGDVKRIVFDENRLYTYKELKTAWIPVFQTIFTDAREQEVVGTSSKLLNNMQYFAWEGGIGSNPEAFAENGTQKYHLSPNSGVVIRLGGSGEIPISEVFQLDNVIREYIDNSQRNGSRIYMGFDRFNGNLIISFSESPDYIYTNPFDQSNWQIYDTLPPDDQDYTIVSNPTHGDLDLTDPRLPIYTPDEDYIGYDEFTYSAIIDGIEVEKKVCITVTPLQQSFSWRVKASSAFCVKDDANLNTGYIGWTTLEQVGDFDGSLSGVEKPNIETDANYVEPVFNDVDCPVSPPPPECPDRALVFQICNENSAKDDNFDVYLNGNLIGTVILDENAQIGSVFIASLDEPEIIDPDFDCPIENMVYYYFDPAYVVGGENIINMVNIQNNESGNAGTVGIRNYKITGGVLEDPCVVDDLVYTGSSGASFQLEFDYLDCCPQDGSGS